MLWNGTTQLLESTFSMRYGDTIPSRLTLPLYKGLTGTAAGERRILRVNDTVEDPRYIKCDVGFDTRSELGRPAAAAGPPDRRPRPRKHAIA